MIEKLLIRTSTLEPQLLASLERREVVLWVRDLPLKDLPISEVVTFLGLPWKFVLSEVFEQSLGEALEASNSFDNPQIRKRGFIHIVDTDPSQIEFPKRSLPIFLLNGRGPLGNPSEFSAQLRRFTMLNVLRQSGARDVLVISQSSDPIPPELTELWRAGFRSHLHFACESAGAVQLVDSWLNSTTHVAAAHVVQAGLADTLSQLLHRYHDTYPETRRIIRVRDGAGDIQQLDVTGIDDPERPLLGRYSLLEERDLTPLTPNELREDEFVSFFRDASGSWLPYAANLPWMRDSGTISKFKALLRKLDTVGSQESCIAYIASEPGAGGTTLARALAWEFGRLGYPVLVARPVPFTPEALPVVNFLTRANALASANTDVHRYEVPWIILFDTLHWQSREGELVRFRNEMVNSGRTVCILCIATVPLPLEYLKGAHFTRVAELNHSIDLESARSLGRHLNQFLSQYGKDRKEWQWDEFYKVHTIRYLEGIAAFWVTLSFWIQGQYDLTESIQKWVYENFKSHVNDTTLRHAIVDIAALSTERLPLTERLLPASTDAWPTSQHLEDLRTSLGPLGLVRISEDGHGYWALVHDILGRFLINALFYDGVARADLGYADARDAEHLRFLILRKVALNPRLGERDLRTMGEEFATSIFKVDPDHGRGSFSLFWREVLDTLDSMPRSLRDTSRVFRHHTAVSRRRIARLAGPYYDVAPTDQLALLNAAIDDLNYALTSIAYSPGSEPNLNIYNSLANAYFDLAEVESRSGASSERIAGLRRLAAESTRKAYEESPTNSFVIETYVKDLLQGATVEPDTAIDKSIEALGLLFSALTSDSMTYREARLLSLAERALRILLQQRPPSASNIEPQSALDVLLGAWQALGSAASSDSGTLFAAIPQARIEEALLLLSHPAAAGNTLALRLRYDLLALSQPLGFASQLEILEELQGLRFKPTPQLDLEYAILLFQRERAVEGDSKFRGLRRLWRESEHFVMVPDRLKWLRTPQGTALQVVTAVTGSDSDVRPMARVREFSNIRVPFRPEEHSMRDLRPNLRFSCHVSFGHNGPFLRPITAGPEVET